MASLKSANISKPADLKRKKIGVYSPSSGTRQNLLVLLHQAGLSELMSQIVVTGLLNFAPPLQGQVDATAATDTGLLVGRHKGIGDVNVMEVRNYLERVERPCSWSAKRSTSRSSRCSSASSRPIARALRG